MLFRKKIQLLGHGKVGKSYGLLTFFRFGSLFLGALWMCFLGLLFTLYIFTFHQQSDFQKESYRIKYEKQELLDISQNEQKGLSDMQSFQYIEDNIGGMVDVDDIKYIDL